MGSPARRVEKTRTTGRQEIRDHRERKHTTWGRRVGKESESKDQREDDARRENHCGAGPTDQGTGEPDVHESTCRRLERPQLQQVRPARNMPCLVRVGDTGRCLLSREVSGHKKMLERWRRQYNTMRPHSALGYRQPAPAAISPASLNGLIMSPALS